jgi:pyruvate,orthophosphate dikinase
VRAIVEAAMDAEEQGYKTFPEIMIPLVTHVNELQIQADVVNEISEEIFVKRGRRINIHIGTMIELPRAALTASEIAKVANFFSFGTNDLTQTTFGISRDDSAAFLPYYMEKKIFPTDPFQTLDRSGVGRLIEIATAAGRSVRPNLEIGICGEHGGDPDSVEFCHMTGLNYVSCSPFRVPIARLAAARAALHYLR